MVGHSIRPEISGPFLVHVALSGAHLVNLFSSKALDQSSIDLDNTGLPEVERDFK